MSLTGIFRTSISFLELTVIVTPDTVEHHTTILSAFVVVRLTSLPYFKCYLENTWDLTSKEAPTYTVNKI